MSAVLKRRVNVRVFVHDGVHVRACVQVCMCMWVCACVHVHVCIVHECAHCLCMWVGIHTTLRMWLRLCVRYLSL